MKPEYNLCENLRSHWNRSICKALSLDSSTST